jgi:hypothetical protein
MIFPAFWQAVEDLPLAQYVAASTWAFPTFESIHVIAIVTVVGSIAVMDLRLLGVASRECAVTEMSRDTLPWTWGAFVVAMITGGLLFMSKATTYMVNPFFLWKMVLIAIAGLNLAIFHFFTWRTVKHWDQGCEVPLPGKIAGGVSLGFWVVVVCVARWIGFTLDKFSTN